MVKMRFGLLLTFGFALAAVSTQGYAAELRIFTPSALWTVLKKIGPQFERSTGHKLNVMGGISETLARRIEGGEIVDIFVGPAPPMDRLVQGSKILPDTRVPLARSGIGVEVRAGAPKPDIGSLEAFKRALLNAKSIGYLRTGASGVHLAGAFERLGIAEAIKPKVTRPATDTVSELVAKGEIELGMVVMTQIVTTAGVELVGPIPNEIQFYVRWFGGVTANSKAPEAARDFLKFLTGPAADPILKGQGMERG